MTKVSYIVNQITFNSYAKAMEEKAKTGKQLIIRYTFSNELERSKPDEGFRKRMQSYFNSKRKGAVN